MFGSALNFVIFFRLIKFVFENKSKVKTDKMFLKKPIHLLIMLSMAMVGSALTPSSFLNTIDKDRLKNIFKTSVAQEDLPSVAYSILGFKLLGETAPDSANLCKKLQKAIDGQDVQVAAVYQAVVASKALDGCNLQLSAVASKVVIIVFKIYLCRLVKSYFHRHCFLSLLRCINIENSKIIIMLN